MRSALSVVLLSCAAGVLVAEPATLQFKTNSAAVHQHGTLSWTVPAAWTDTGADGTPPPTAPITLRFRAPGNRPTVLLAVFWDGIGAQQAKPGAELFPVLVKALAEKQYAAGSVEKTAKVETFKDDTVAVSYASFTDLKFTGKEPPPDETRNITVGMFRCGHLWGNFTLLTNDKDGDEFKQAMAVVKSLRAETLAK